MPVPAPDGALLGDEALARLQQRQQPFRVRFACDNADLLQRAGQRIRCFHVRNQRRNALRQAGVAGMISRGAPMGRRVRFER
ncbi:hypothetical protein D9M70_545830 [compost metagenome]